ncbi:MAG: UvrD-helicase domain-containing protein [Candidatus Vogelbacteria bacterium]|nr:UvrD-helicase domain-containing protein [Candidatus Vogelbacteria bacterium]
MLRCNSATSGSVIKRLEGIFEYIFVDEVQDMSGYDLDLLQLLFESRITLVGVGDPRQWIYSTNNSSRHKKYRGSEISKWFDHMKSSGLCELIHHNECYRCNQVICDFADALYPSFVPTVSKYTDLTGHDGVFTLRSSDLGNYMMRFAPTILCYDKNAETYGHSALNFGQAKGMTYERVVICPTGPIRAFLEGGDAQALKDISRAKLYVAITRAKSSVAFIYDGRKNVVIPEFISDVE